MSLNQIAADMKTAARRQGKIVRNPLANGAQLTLECARVETQDTFLLTVTRAGNKPPAEGTKAGKAWQTELETFARFFCGTTARVVGKTKMLQGAYAATICWNEPAQDALGGIPQTLDEMKQWAQSLGPGVRITGVNVLTGEMPPARALPKQG